MKYWIIGLVLMMSSLQGVTVEITQQDMISDDEAYLEKTLEKEDASDQKFSQLVKSTMELMGPSDKEATSVATDTTSVTP
jgi:hypothetical protein